MDSDPGPGPIRLAVLNDYAIIVNGIVAVFSADPQRFVVVHTDDTSAKGGALSDSLAVDVVLLDPFGSPTSLRERISTGAAARDRKYVVLSWHSSAASVAAAFELGCAGYLSKTLDAESLMTAVEEIHHGERVVSLSAKWPTTASVDGWPGKEVGLTARESEILCLVAQGLANRDIVERSFIGPESLKSHIRSAYRKIGVTTRSEAIVWCHRHGLTPH